MRRIALSTLFLALTSTTAIAADRQGSVASSDYIAVSAGIFNVIDDGESPAQFSGEYRFREWDYGVRPTLGASIDVDGGLYGYGGINWEIPLGAQFLLIPNFMVGFYHEGGSRDLGGALEFRSGIEVAYQFENAHRAGIAFNHISNASIYDKNPGAETLLVNYSVPVSTLFNR